MRDTREWSDIVFQVSVAIIVTELVVLSIGFNLAAGVGVAVWVLSFYDIRGPGAAPLPSAVRAAARLTVTRRAGISATS